MTMELEDAPKRGVNPKDTFGNKKPSLSSIPPTALIHLGLAMEDGAKKYGRFNWRGTHVDALVYYDAAMRHLLEWRDGADMASDSGVCHLAHAMACCAILLDAQEGGNLDDTRGYERSPGVRSSSEVDQRVADLIKRVTQHRSKDQ